MMGKTIDSVTYYTDKGIITFDLNDEKVLTKTGVTAKVAGIHTTDTEATVTLVELFRRDLQQNMRLMEQKLYMQTARSQPEHWKQAPTLWSSAIQMVNMHQFRQLSV